MKNWKWPLLQKVVTGVYLNFSFCASSNAALRDFSSWSASSSLIFRTASWPSLAERASVRSSTCDRSSRNIRSVWDCSEFHLSARRRVWFNSIWNQTINQNRGRGVEMSISLFLSCLNSYHPASLLLSGWLKPSPGWGRPPHCAAADFPDADWTGCGSVAPLWEEEEAPACWTPEGRPSLSLNFQVCLWWPVGGEERTHKNIQI